MNCAAFRGLVCRRMMTYVNSTSLCAVLRLPFGTMIPRRAPRSDLPRPLRHAARSEERQPWHPRIDCAKLGCLHNCALDHRLDEGLPIQDGPVEDYLAERVIDNSLSTVECVDVNAELLRARSSPDNGGVEAQIVYWKSGCSSKLSVRPGVS
jgi:hypothetical protein